MEKNISDMPLYELSRWCSLMYAVNLIADECEERGKDFNTINMEPLYIRKYVERISDNVAKVIEQELEEEKQKQMVQLQQNILEQCIHNS